MATISIAAPAASASDGNALEDLYASRLSVDEHTVMLVVATCFAAPPLLICGFIWLLRSPKHAGFRRILAPRVAGPDFISRYLRRSDFNLIKLMWPDPEQPISFDQVVYLNFSRLCRNVLMCLMPLALYLLIPTYGQGGSAAKSASVNEVQLDTSSMSGFVESLNATSQIETASNFLKTFTIKNTKTSSLWMPVVYSYLATAIAHAWLVYYSRKIIGLKGLWIKRKRGHEPFVRELLFLHLSDLGFKSDGKSNDAGPMQQAIADAFVRIGAKQPDVRLGRKVARTFGDKLKGVFVHDAPQERIDVINKFNETIVDCERKMLHIATKWKEGLVNVVGDQSFHRVIPTEAKAIRKDISRLKASLRTTIEGTKQDSAKTEKAIARLKEIQAPENATVGQYLVTIKKLADIARQLPNVKAAVLMQQFGHLLKRMSEGENKELLRARFELIKKIRKLRKLHRAYLKLSTADQITQMKLDNYAILTFHSVEDANNALELVLKKGFKLHMPSFGKGKKTVEKKVPRRGYVTHCFPVEDLHWENLGATKKVSRTKYWWFRATYALLFAAYVGPVGLISAGSNLEALGAVVPIIGRLAERYPGPAKTASSLLPPLIMSLMNSIALPLIIGWLTALKGSYSQSSQYGLIMRYIYPFQVLQQFFVFILFGSLLVAIEQLEGAGFWSHLPTVLKNLCLAAPGSVVNASNYYMQWFALQAASSLVGFVYGLNEFLLGSLLRYAGQNTYRDTHDKMKPLPFDAGYRMSSLLFQFTLAMIMTPIAPLCGIVGSYLLFWVNGMYRFQIMCVCGDRFEGQGRIWRSLSDRFQVALVIMHVVVAGVLASLDAPTIVWSTALGPIALALLLKPHLRTLERQLKLVKTSSSPARTLGSLATGTYTYRPEIDPRVDPLHKLLLYVDQAEGRDAVLGYVAWVMPRKLRAFLMGLVSIERGGEGETTGRVAKMRAEAAAALKAREEEEKRRDGEALKKERDHEAKEAEEILFGNGDDKEKVVARVDSEVASATNVEKEEKPKPES